MAPRASSRRSVPSDEATTAKTSVANNETPGVNHDARAGAFARALR